MILLLMVITVFLQIVTRYVFFYSLPWSEELSRYLFAWLIFIGASLGVGEESQIRIDIIDTLVKGGFRKIVNLLQYVLSFGTVTVLIFSTAKILQIGMRQRSPAMHIPMTYIYLCIPVGLALVNLELFVKMLNIAKKILKKEGVQ